MYLKWYYVLWVHIFFQVQQIMKREFSDSRTDSQIDKWSVCNLLELIHMSSSKWSGQTCVCVSTLRVVCEFVFFWSIFWAILIDKRKRHKELEEVVGSFADFLAIWFITITYFTQTYACTCTQKAKGQSKRPANLSKAKIVAVLQHVFYEPLSVVLSTFVRKTMHVFTDIWFINSYNSYKFVLFSSSLLPCNGNFSIYIYILFSRE